MGGIVRNAVGLAESALVLGWAMAKAVGDLTTSERIELAKQKMTAIVGHAVHLIELHETNQIVVFSDALAKQIPRSHAANAFNSFQDSSFRFEIIRLCVLWDHCRPTDLTLESVPAVIQLVDDDHVKAALVEEMRSHYAAIEPHIINLSDDPEMRAIEIEMSRRSSTHFADQQAARTQRWLSTAIRWAKKHEHAPRVQTIRNFRDKHLAHSLSKSRLEERAAAAGGTIAPMNYGHGRWLYQRTLAIVNNLYLSINGSGFDWTGSVEIARKNAKNLWMNCTFTVPVRRGT
jgi:AbiU2